MRVRSGFRAGRWASSVAAVLGPFVAASCDRDTAFEPIPVGVATVQVLAYLEYDGESGFGGLDDAAAGLDFQVVLPGSNTPVAEGSADADGELQLEAIPAGTYDLRVDPAYLADSLVLTGIDTTRVTLMADDVVAIQVGVTPHTRTVAAARELPEGRRVWVTGVALNDRRSSIDGAVHVLQEGVGAIRVVFPSATGGAPGDSVRALGRTMGTGDDRVLADGILDVVAPDVRPVFPLEVTLDEARTAGGGDLDARLVLVRGGTITDTATVPLVGLRVRLTDGSETVELFLPQRNGFDPEIVELGRTVLAAAGLLVPDPNNAGDWRIVPRTTGDVDIEEPPP